MFSKKLASLFCILLFTTHLAFGAGLGIDKDENDVALQGYDPVAYFLVGKATKGESTYSAAHDNAIYLFASEANRDLFKADPKKYAPQYGGFCSLSLTIGQNVSPDPNAFSVIEDKLYLTVSQDAQKIWQENIEVNIKKADKFYSSESE